MKLQKRLSLAVSVLLAITASLSELSMATQSHSLTNSQGTDNQGQIIANARLRWRRTRAPRWRPILARRGSCLAKDAQFIPIIPPDSTGNNLDKFTYEKSLWESSAAYPTILFYLSDNSFVKGELTLQNKEGKDIYHADLKLPNQPGFISVKLPEFSKDGKVLPPLAVGETYRWIISIDCQEDFDPEIGGGIYRIDPETTLANTESDSSFVTLDQALQEAKPEDLPGIYQQASDWYNTVSSLADLIQSQPNNPTWKQQWYDLLTDVGYKNIADPTFIKSAEVVNVDLELDHDD